MKLYENTQKIKRPFSLVMVHIAIPFFFALWALISIPIFKDPRIGEYEKAEILGEGLPFIFLVVYVKYIVSLVPSCFLRLLLRKPLRKKWLPLDVEPDGRLAQVLKPRRAVRVVHGQKARAEPCRAFLLPFGPVPPAQEARQVFLNGRRQVERIPELLPPQVLRGILPAQVLWTVKAEKNKP